MEGSFVEPWFFLDWFGCGVGDGGGVGFYMGRVGEVGVGMGLTFMVDSRVYHDGDSGNSVDEGHQRKCCLVGFVFCLQ